MEKEKQQAIDELILAYSLGGSAVREFASDLWDLAFQGGYDRATSDEEKLAEEVEET